MSVARQRSNSSSEKRPILEGEMSASGGAVEEDAMHDEKHQPLPLSTKLVYALPNFAGAAMWIPAGIHIHKFYADVVLVPVGYMALAIALARSGDALIDPMMGWLSDSTSTRWGRRRPFIVVGAPLCALSYWCLFTPPRSFDPRLSAMWFGLFFGLFFFFWTMSRMPHYALGPELTQDYHERSTLFAWGETFAILGTMVASVLPGLMFHFIPDHRQVFSLMSGSFAVVLMLLYYNLVFWIREKPNLSNVNPLIPGVRRALRNQPFRVLLLTYIMNSITSAIPGTMLPFFVTYVLQPQNPEMWLTIFLALFFGSSFVSIPMWLNTSRRIGKKNTWLISFGIHITGTVSTFFLRPGDIVPMCMLLMWSGAATGAGMFLVPAIQADVIDYDELYTGERREGQYVTFWAMIPKFLSIPSAAVPIALLGALGYVPNADQSDQVKTCIRVLYSLLPACAAIGAFLMALRFPISEEIHRRIMQGIKLHRRGQYALDPITGDQVPPPSQDVDVQANLLDHFSKRELESVIERGPLFMLFGIILSGVMCVAVGCACVMYVFLHISPTSGPTAVVGVVVAGICFALFVFHTVRASEARRLYFNPISDRAIRRHLLTLERGTSRTPRDAFNEEEYGEEDPFFE